MPSNLQDFLKKKLTAVAVAGSVDDGKSTFIGRFLYDTKSAKEDMLRNVSYLSRTYSGVPLDFALFVDGLKKELEQGITIDVAFRYFYTPEKKVVLIDTPGHPQYTQNAFSGLSLGDAAILITDVSRGITSQSIKLLSFSYLLGVRELLILISKIDAINYEWSKIKEFERRIIETISKIKKTYEEAGFLVSEPPTYILPVSAINGDNIVKITYDPENRGYISVYDWINNLKLENHSMPYMIGIVNGITRDSQGRYIGLYLISGKVHKGQPITILPQRVKTNIKEIYYGEEEFEEVLSPMPCTITLASDVDITYEQLIVSNEDILNNESELEVIFLWTSRRKFIQEKRYLLRNKVGTYPCYISSPIVAIDVENFTSYISDNMTENNIYKAKLILPGDFYYLPYFKNKDLGAFILIEEFWNETVAAGIIL